MTQNGVVGLFLFGKSILSVNYTLLLEVKYVEFLLLL